MTVSPGLFAGLIIIALVAGALIGQAAMLIWATRDVGRDFEDAP